MSAPATEPRQRKKGAAAKGGEKPPQGDPKSKPKAAENAGRRAASRKTKIMLSLLFIPVGLFLVYQNAHFLLGPLLPWLQEVKERLEPVPGLGKGLPMNFSADELKKDAVREAFQHAWLAYERDAMGDDEYHPIGHTGTNLTADGGIGYTVVDSIDTMVIMGLHDEYDRARDWIAHKLRFDVDGNVSTFETTIRVLGGLLATYHLTGEEMFLDRAKDLADHILPAFDTPTGLPLTLVNLAKRQGVADPDNKGLVSTAEVSTLQLEFKYLSYLTDEDVYWDKAERVMSVVKKAHLSSGLASIFMSPTDGRFAMSTIRLGSRGDSYYEYLLKQYIQTSATEGVYRSMYDDAMNGVTKHLIRKTPNLHLTYTSELIPQRSRTGEIAWRLIPKQDHLACFLGGSLMLGAVTTGAVKQPVSVPPKLDELSLQGRRDWRNGWELIETCMRTHHTKTGLSPEIAHFVQLSNEFDKDFAPEDWYIKGAKEREATGESSYDARYILRPETIESLFLAYRLTGDARYRAYGWAIFQAIERHCRIASGGYASVLDVNRVPATHEDKMETFLMSETLKYLYLLFEDASVLSLDKYVFNTEAHPFPIFNPTRRTGFS